MLQTENRFEELIQRLQIGVLVLGPDGELVTANDVAPKLLNITPDEFARRGIFDPSWTVVREDGSPFEVKDRPNVRALATREAVHDVVLGVRKPHSQEIVWLLANVDPIRGDNGVLEEVVCT